MAIKEHNSPSTGADGTQAPRANESLKSACTALLDAEVLCCAARSVVDDLIDLGPDADTFNRLNAALACLNQMYDILQPAQEAAFNEVNRLEGTPLSPSSTLEAGGAA